MHDGPAARPTPHRLASGEFLLFLNAADQLAETGSLARVRQAIDDTVDVIHGDIIFHLPRGALIYRRSNWAFRCLPLSVRERVY